jgi:hypothetical protein
MSDTTDAAIGTKKHATELVARLKAHWLARGYEIATYVTIERVSDDKDSTFYGVRSNLIGGLPPNWRGTHVRPGRFPPPWSIEDNGA